LRHSIELELGPHHPSLRSPASTWKQILLIWWPPDSYKVATR